MPTSTMAPSKEELPPCPTDPRITPLPALKPDLFERAWSSTPHPTLPLLATAHGKSVTVFSLSTLSPHSTLTGGHTRSVRSVTWKPNLPPHHLCLVTGSFDSTAALWRWGDADDSGGTDAPFETEMTGRLARSPGSVSGSDTEDKEWEFTLVLEGHDSEVKSAVFSPSGAHLATCSRDQTVWIWEDIGTSEGDDEWETVAVLNEHEGDMKALAWCPDVPGRNSRRGLYSPDVLASASYDNTVRIWREDGDGEWVCVAVLEGHDGTVWGVQWEGRPRSGDKYPRLLTYSADRTIRIWSLQQEEEEEQAEEEASGERASAAAAGSGRGAWSGLGTIPNTMRKSLREEWHCSAVLPSGHTRDIYSAAWSATTGLVASTGSDGTIVVYGEDPEATQGPINKGESEPASEPRSVERVSSDDQDPSRPRGNWRILTKVKNAHGPYEINHVTWCRRFDAGAAKKGEEEMLVTTGDEGSVRLWQVSSA